MTVPLCAACPRPSPLSHLCAGCSALLVSTLERMPGLLADLELTATKQARTSGGGKRGTGHETDLPYDEHAAALYDQAVNAVTTWARHVEESRHTRGPAHPAAAAAWLARQVEWISHHEAAGVMLAEFRRLAARITAAIDRRTDQVFFGACQAETVSIGLTADADRIVATAYAVRCTAELWGSKDRPTVRCRDCGAVHSVAERQDRKERAALDLVLPVEQIRAALPDRLAVLINAATVRSWKHRGQLGGGHPAGTYNVGEVKVLLERRADQLDRIKDRLERMAHPKR